MQRPGAVRMGSQSDEFASHVRAEGRVDSRPSGKADPGSELHDVALGVVLTLSIVCALSTPHSAQSRTKTAPPSQSVTPAVESPARALGILRLPNNLPPVDSLVAAKDDPFFPSRARTEHGPVTPDMFTSPESCKECHSEIYEQWSGSMMAHAWTDPVYREILRRASVATE